MFSDVPRGLGFVLCAAWLLASAAGPAFAGCRPADRPVIAEVYYDAAGDDSGLEFVELLNPAAARFPLAGVRLEAGDGAGPGRWSLRWTGAAADTIAPGRRFVIGGARVAPAPDAIATLDLQNGPDAVRLVWPDGVIEIVGYGALALPEYFCEAPAEDVSSGSALARIPDDADRGSNALDFRAAPPTPGTANQPVRDVALAGGSLALDPEQPEPGAAARAAVGLVVRGTHGFAAGEVTIQLEYRDEVVASRALEVPLAPSESTRVEIPVTFGSAGAGLLVARSRGAGDENAANDLDSLRVRVGPGPLEITEIQFHPARDEGEWVEVRNRTDAPLDLAVFKLGDRGGARGTIRAGPAWLGPGNYAVLAQARDRLLAVFTALDTTRVCAVSPWSALNNTDDASGVADIVTLAERDGTPCSRVPYRAAGIPDGVPIEREPGGSWGRDSDPAGTPLAPPVALPSLPRRFVIAPRRVAQSAAPRLRLDWSLPWAPQRLEVIAYDLAGRRAAVVMPPAPAFARGGAWWDAGELLPGVYVLALAARSATGASIAEIEPVRVTGREP